MKPPVPLEDWQDDLEAGIASQATQPVTVRVFRETTSTQDIAKSYASGHALIVANHQTGGRGRLGRRWLSTPGASVLMSLRWPSDSLSTSHDQVSLRVGVALANAVQQMISAEAVRLKWPNDVWIEQRKIAGILIEQANQAYIIGIGMNVTDQACPDESLRPWTTSLQEIGCNADRLEVIKTIYRHISRSLSSASLDETLRAWRKYAPLGQRHTFEHHHQQITGQVIDLDPDHGLIIRRDTGEIITLPAATTSVVKESEHE